jgi:hypothetical protein
MSKTNLYKLCLAAIAAGYLVFGGILILAIAGRNRVYTEKMDNFVLSDEKDLCYNIENYAEVTNKKAEISGWLVQKGQTYEYYNYGANVHGAGVYNNMHLACVDDNSEQVYILPTQLSIRNDVTEYIADGIDYKYSGFESKFPVYYEQLIDKNGLYVVIKDTDGNQFIYRLRYGREQ